MLVRLYVALKKVTCFSTCYRRDQSPPVAEPDFIRLPDIRLKSSCIRSLVQPKSVDDLTWKKANFHVTDSISGGVQRFTIVEYAESGQQAFLKTVEPLRKKEFEEIFAFACGEFKRGQVICLDRTFLAIG